MNETRRKPTTGRQSPSLFDKWHGIFYMPSRIDEAGHTKAFDYPVAEHWGKAEMFSSAGGTRTDNTSVRSRTHYQLSHPGSPGGSLTSGPQQGGSSPNWGDSLYRTAPPREGHLHGAPISRNISQCNQVKNKANKAELNEFVVNKICTTYNSCPLVCHMKAIGYT